MMPKSDVQQVRIKLLILSRGGRGASGPGDVFSLDEIMEDWSEVICNLMSNRLG